MDSQGMFSVVKAQDKDTSSGTSESTAPNFNFATAYTQDKPTSSGTSESAAPCNFVAAYTQDKRTSSGTLVYTAPNFNFVTANAHLKRTSCGTSATSVPDFKFGSRSLIDLNKAYSFKISDSCNDKIGKILERHDHVFLEWAIPDFLSQNAAVLHSPEFPFSECSWSLNLHPKVNDDKMVISLSLKPTTAVLKEFSFTVAVKQSDGTLKWKKALRCHFRKFKTYCSQNLFWKRQELIKNKSTLLTSDTLTIAFSVQEGIPFIVGEKEKRLETLSSDLRDLFVNKSQSDVTIKVTSQCQEAEFQAHKAILVARSSVFASAFEHEMTEKETGVVNIEDCDLNSFEDFLHFLYTGEIRDISFNIAYGLYVTADKYNVQELKSCCLSYMKHNLAADNVCTVIALADQYDEIDLVSSAENYFCRNYSKVLSTTEWELFFKANYRLANKVLKRVISKDEIQTSDG